MFWDRAFMQFAGFTVGKTQSFFDLFTYGGGMSYHNVRTAGDTGAAGLTVWAYTAQFGNGFSGTLSLEAPQGHNRAPVVDVTPAGFFGKRRHRRRQRVRSGQRAGNGMRMPDIVANLRVDQAWGFFGVSGALHEAERRVLSHRRQRQQRPSRRQARLGGCDWRTAQPRRRRPDRRQLLLHGRCCRLLHQRRHAAGLQCQHQRLVGVDRGRRVRHRNSGRADPGVELPRRLPAHLEPEVADVDLRRLRQRRVQRHRDQHHQLALRGGRCRGLRRACRQQGRRRSPP